MSVNKAILIGRLGRDPDLRYTPGGRAVCSFSLATSEAWKGQDGQRNESTTWHNIVAWGKQAEVIKEYLRKGREVYIEGRIDNRSYDDKEGNKKYVSEVVVQQFRFIGSRADAEVPASEPPPADEVAQPPDSGNDDDLPF
ncbi:MAG TPA: single-stranded DNA-binding protein [Acidobacteriota bacterium]|nr:single-stranded DNA-binding protein [Acidobacteriota bacterium]